jgi:hypothetical protein
MLLAAASAELWRIIPEMSGLDRVANAVRAARLGALVLILTGAIGGSWAAVQPGRGLAVAPARSARLSPALDQAGRTPYVIIWNPSATCGGIDPDGKPASVTLVPVGGAEQAWRGCPTP